MMIAPPPYTEHYKVEHDDLPGHVVFIRILIIGEDYSPSKKIIRPKNDLHVQLTYACHGELRNIPPPFSPKFKKVYESVLKLILLQFRDRMSPISKIHVHGSWFKSYTV